MMVRWDGITKSAVLQEDEIVIRHKLADAAREYNWEKTLKILDERPDLVNATRLDGRSLYTPLHQAAYGNAPVEVIQKMIELGAWRTLKNADGERAVDIAIKKQHQHLVPLLKPVYERHVPSDTLQRIQNCFHDIFLSRTNKLIQKSGFRLPELAVLLEVEEPRMWCPVPGMYGGFNFWLDGEGETVKLMCFSGSRIVGGSERYHEISTQEVKLVDEGFSYSSKSS